MLSEVAHKSMSIAQVFNDALPDRSDRARCELVRKYVRSMFLAHCETIDIHVLSTGNPGKVEVSSTAMLGFERFYNATFKQDLYTDLRNSDEFSRLSPGDMPCNVLGPQHQILLGKAETRAPLPLEDIQAIWDRQGDVVVRVPQG